jgi:hypothetical protein
MPTRYFLARQAVLAIAVEAVEATAESLIGSDANLLVYNVQYEPTLNQFERKPLLPDMSPLGPIAGKRMGKFTFQTELKGSGYVGVAPALGRILRACKAAETISQTVGALNQTTAGSTDNKLRIGATDNIELSAAFTSGGSGETPNLARLILKRGGTIPAGKKVWVEIQTDATGDPSGTAVTDGVSNTVEAAGIHTAYETITFVFPTAPTLTASTAYHLVLKGDYTPDSTNVIYWRSNTVGSGGNGEIKDASWGDVATSDFEAVLAAGISVTYTPTPSPPSVTMGFFAVPSSGSSLNMIVSGSRGKWKFSPNVGDPGMLDCEFNGNYESIVDGTAPSPVGLESTKPPAFLSTSLTCHGDSGHKISKFGMDQGHTLTMRTDPVTASGYFSCIHTDTQPTFSFDPEVRLVADHDYFGKMMANAEAALSFVLGSTPGNIITVSAPKAQYIQIKPADRDGLKILNIDGRLNRSVGNDEWSVAFT